MIDGTQLTFGDEVIGVHLWATQLRKIMKSRGVDPDSFVGRRAYQRQWKVSEINRGVTTARPPAAAVVQAQI